MCCTVPDVRKHGCNTAAPRVQVSNGCSCCTSSSCQLQDVGVSLEGHASSLVGRQSCWLGWPAVLLTNMLHGQQMMARYLHSLINKDPEQPATQQCCAPNTLLTESENRNGCHRLVIPNPAHALCVARLGRTSAQRTRTFLSAVVTNLVALIYLFTTYTSLHTTVHLQKFMKQSCNRASAACQTQCCISPLWATVRYSASPQHPLTIPALTHTHTAVLCFAAPQLSLRHTLFNLEPTTKAGPRPSSAGLLHCWWQTWHAVQPPTHHQKLAHSPAQPGSFTAAGGTPDRVALPGCPCTHDQQPASLPSPPLVCS
jgi:hypothetical protein